MAMNETVRSGSGHSVYGSCARVSVLMLVAVGIVSSLSGQVARLTGKDAGAIEALRNADDALGGTRVVEGLRSLRAMGRTTTTPVMGLPRERKIELRMLLPDNLLVIVTDPTTAEYSGVSGKNHLRAFISNGTRTPGNYPADQAQMERARFARLTLGMFLSGGPLGALSATTAAESGSDSGYRLDVASADGPIGQLGLHPQLNLPVVLRYRARIRMPPAKSVSGEGSGSGRLPPLEDVDVTMTFGDRMAVGGLLFPKSILVEARGIKLEVVQFDEVFVNPGLTLRDFQITM